MQKIIINFAAAIFFFCVALAISGCRGGGGGGSSGGSSGTEGSRSESYVSGGSSGSGSGSLISDSGSLAKVHNPEPSSILLFATGLGGMVAYARARMKK